MPVGRSRVLARRDLGRPLLALLHEAGGLCVQGGDGRGELVAGSLTVGVEALELPDAPLAQQRLDGFPHWWHPELVSQACAYALVTDIFPDVAERIFINRLGKNGSGALRALLYSDNAMARLRAGKLLTLLDGCAFTELTELDSTHSKRVIEELLHTGQLRAEGFVALKQLLMTARQRQSANPTLLAAFGLYVNGYTRMEIAKLLGCSVANVRNYINLIYHIFEIDNEGFASRQDRQQRLAEMAREHGFI